MSAAFGHRFDDTGRPIESGTDIDRDFDAYLAERRAHVEKFLDQWVPSEDTPPETISRAVRYSLFAGGKRLRPILVLASAEAVGGPDPRGHRSSLLFRLR
jgi:geranylgeranyl pyrophosphate synthase